MTAQPLSSEETAARQRWMSVLAKAEAEAVVEAWASTGMTPDYTVLRPAETGLVMTRGRIGGTGDAFNLGEMTVTRCSVRLADGTVGHAYVSSRQKAHAEAAAVIDALMQGQDQDRLEADVIAPLETAMAERRDVHARKAAATKVDFFTLSRTTKPK